MSSEDIRDMDKEDPDYIAEKARIDGIAQTVQNVWDDIENNVLDTCNSENEAYSLVMNYTYRTNEKNVFRFQDFDYDLNEYTFSFLWCCHAIAHFVETYDAFKKEQANVSA